MVPSRGLTGERLTRRGPPWPSPVLDVRSAKVDQQNGDANPGTLAAERVPRALAEGGMAKGRRGDERPEARGR